MKTILVDAWNTFVTKDGINEDLHKLLEEYSNRKIILTNANDEQIVTLRLTNLPYELFTLKHNPDKIDSEYYKEMFKQLNLTKDSVVYFEHNEDAVKSAQSVGITSHHYDKDKKDIETLKQFLDQNLV